MKILRDERKYCIILTVLTITGLILRFYHIDSNSVWLDEAITLKLSILPVPVMWQAILSDNSPPLFYFIEHIMLQFGNSEFILRFIPAIAGTMTIPAFYFLGKEFHSRGVGIVAAALLAFSSYNLFFSQEARAYSVVLLIFSITLIYYFKAFRTNSLQHWILCGFFSAVMCWLHYTAFPMVIILLLFALARNVYKERSGFSSLKPVIMAAAFSLVLVAPMIILAIHSLRLKVSSPFNWGFKGYLLIIEIFQQFLGNFSGKNEIIVVILFLLCLSGLFQLYRTKKEKLLFLILGIAIPLLAGYYLSYKMSMDPRYFILILPFLFLAISVSLITFQEVEKKPGFPVIALIIVILISIPPLQMYYPAGTECRLEKCAENWRTFSDELRAYAHEGDIIIVIPSYYREPLNYYYNTSSENTIEVGASTTKDLEKIPASNNSSRKLFFILGNIEETDLSGELLPWIKAHTTFIRQNRRISLYGIP